MSKQTDALVVLEEVAASLRESAEAIEDGNDYNRGMRMGYYEALSTLLAQCAMAGISADAIGLAGFKAESVLSPTKKAA